MASRWKSKVLLGVALAFTTMPPTARAQEQGRAWPPALPGLEGTATVESERFLQVPESVQEVMKNGLDSKAKPAPYADKPAPFVVAKVPPRVEVALHRDLPHNGLSADQQPRKDVETPYWSSWGDIGVAADGRVYCAIGDHGYDFAGTASCFLYEWDPTTRNLRQVADVNKIGPPLQGGEPSWSKIHARVSAGPDGRIYFTGTLNDGQMARLEQYKWTDARPGGQLLHYDPATGTSEVFANLPRGRVTATSLIDPKHNRWWCNLEARTTGDALFAIDLATGKPVFQSPDGVVGMNRDFAITADGDAIFNGKVPGEIWRADVETGTIAKLNATLPAPLRGTTRETKDGYIYGVCGVPYNSSPRRGELFRYHVGRDTVETFGPEWLYGDYTPIVLLSPDERFLYYLPGANGNAIRSGTPVIQYHIASGQRKVLAFLREGLEQQVHYTPAGAFGAGISPDGRTIYANFNGSAAEQYRPPHLRFTTTFGLTAFAAIHIPEEELRDPAGN